ncbi:MAG TPA: hypothetical protein VLH77_04610, partial [Gammaproteobacteria bacterium]|nr:hypothetical protein [Gammaproteobacteria bacterium]
MDLFQKGKKIMDRPKAVLFVSSQLRQREIKMAQALREQGWFIGLIYYDMTPFKPDGYFDFAYEVSSAKKAHQQAQALSPRLVHVFSGAIDDYVTLFCHKKIAPVVIDLNDVFTPSLMSYCPERYAPTQEVLALANGFCARDLQVKCAERYDGCKIPEQLVFYPEYCWGNLSALTSKKPKNEVHVVSVGNVSLETYGMYDCCYLELVKRFIDQGIHFHIYPPWHYRKDYANNSPANFQKDYAQFLELEKNSPYLHIHDSLPADQLITALRQYDFGVISGGFEGFGQRYTHFKPAYVRSCYSGRITDYLDAGLPILINEEVVFDHWLLKRHGVCLDLKDVLKPGFKQKLQVMKQNAALKSQVEATTKKLSIRNNGSRLGKFYSAIMQNNPISNYKSLKPDSIFRKLAQ